MEPDLQLQELQPQIAHATANVFPVRRNGLLRVNRLPEHADTYPEIKDPSIVALPNGSYVMYASIGRSIDQTWIVGRFQSMRPQGPWFETSPVRFKNISGPELCAPAVTYQEKNGMPQWTMYIQTSCFSPDGVIAKAISLDGETFIGEEKPIIDRTMIRNDDHPIIGVYDVGFSEVTINNAREECLLFSAYRRIGCGDIYMSYKNRITRILRQEDVEFHNDPSYEHFEWGLEGAKIEQLGPDCFLMIGVCFLPKPSGFLGNRQRVFFAAARYIEGPYHPIGIPIMPRAVKTGQGENGHPDTFIVGSRFWTIYQEREGDGKPWHLRVTSYNKLALQKSISNFLSGLYPLN